jgi:hypothetical protein
MSEELKLCKDCDHYKGTVEPYWHTCTFPEIPKDINPVTGEVKVNHCSVERSELGHCKPEAVHFKPKQKRGWFR